MRRQQSPIFARLECPRRIWAVAAIHGEATRLADLHGQLARVIEPGDRLVYLGNYLGIGAEITATMDELLSFRRAFLTIPGIEPQDIVHLRGTQEEMWWKLLHVQLATSPLQVFDWMLDNGLDTTLRAYGGSADEARSRFREGVLATTKWTGRLRDNLKAHPGHDDLLASVKRAAFSEGGELLFVHAGVDPNRPLDAQQDIFWWGGADFGAIRDPYDGFQRVIRGFDPDHQGVQFGPATASIDGGAGFGGPLTAICFDLNAEPIETLIA
jgi:serine/threonine protein phosphatase 1